MNQKGGNNSVNIQADEIQLQYNTIYFKELFDVTINTNPLTEIEILERQISVCESIIQNFEASNINNQFIMPNLTLKTGSSYRKVQDLDELVNLFINHDTSTVIFLLGEFGTGKTWLMRNIEYRLAKKFSQNPDINPFPIFFNLSKIADLSYNLTELLIEIIKDKFKLIKIPLPKNFLFLLDSLDEASRKNGFSQFQTFISYLFDYSTLSLNPKIIIASRLTFFKEIDITSKIGSPDPLFNCLEIIIDPWKIDQIQSYIRKQDQIPNHVKNDIEVFTESHREIAGRALILGMLVNNWMSFSELVKCYDFNEYVLFDNLIYVTLHDWANRASTINDPILILKLDFFIKQLAIIFFDTNSHQKIDIITLERWLRKKFENVNFYDLIKVQVKSRSLLVLNDEKTHYQFCHRAVWEFIVAKLIITAIENLGMNKNIVHKKFDEMVIRQGRNSPELYISIARQFVIPLLEKENKLNLLEKYLLKLP